MELIDREALLFEINNPAIYDRHDGQWWIESDIVRAIALEQETIDATPVVHGRWIDGLKCSECRQVDCTKPNYCPNCGAKMDGGEG